MEETTYCLRNFSIQSNLLEHIHNLNSCDPPIWDVLIKKHRKDKTAQQRKYFHKILSMVFEATGDDVEELKMKIKFRVLPLSEIELEGKIYLYPISSEKATRKQYADLIEAALMYSEAAGVQIPQPEYFGYSI